MYVYIYVVCAVISFDFIKKNTGWKLMEGSLKIETTELTPANCILIVNASGVVQFNFTIHKTIKTCFPLSKD